MKNRKPNRLPSYDYSSYGYYFLTICTENRVKHFGEIINGEMSLSKSGIIVHDYWQNIPKYYESVELDQFVVMPNHIHGIIIVNNVGTGQCPVPTKEMKGYLTPTEETQYGLISKIIGAYKSLTARKIKEADNTNFMWQRSFYDHVIRDDHDMMRIQQYIINNPLKWDLDRNNFESKVPAKKRGIW